MGDDVLRSVALILTDIRDEQAPDAFIGHLDTTHFLITSGPDQVEGLEQALRVQVNEAVSFLYPYADQEKASSDLPPSISMGVLKSSTQSSVGIDNLKGR